MSYQQAAEWLGIGERTLKRLVAEGAIRPAYVYRRVLFTEAMLQAFLEKCAAPVITKQRGNVSPKKMPAKGSTR